MCLLNRFCNFHGTEVRPAHRAVISALTDHFKMHFSCPFRIKRQIELIVPTHLKASLAHLQIALCGSRMPFGNVGGMCGKFVGDNTLAYVILIWKSQVLFGGHIASIEVPTIRSSQHQLQR